MRSSNNSFERESGGIVVGTLILTIQACAVIPGLLPSLVLLAVFALPLLILAVAGLVLVGVPVGLMRVVARLARGRSLPPRGQAPITAPSDAIRPAAPVAQPAAGSAR